jgi:hypothetical protein
MVLLAWWFLVPLPPGHRDSGDDGLKLMGPFKTKQECEAVRAEAYRKLVSLIEKTRRATRSEEDKAKQILGELDRTMWEASVRDFSKLPCDEVSKPGS